MYSEDGGESFSDHRRGAKRDVHLIAWHPTAEGRAYQAAGDGAAWSRDAGVTWEAVDAGRDLPYCWALAVDPADPDRWFVSAASGPGAAHSGEAAQGRLYGWEGERWRALPLPGASMPYALVALDGELIAGMTERPGAAERRPGRDLERRSRSRSAGSRRTQRTEEPSSLPVPWGVCYVPGRVWDGREQEERGSRDSAESASCRV